MKDKNTNTEKTTFEKIKFSEPVTIIFGSSVRNYLYADHGKSRCIREYFDSGCSIRDADCENTDDAV